MPPQMQHQPSHPGVGTMMPRASTAMSTSSHHASSSHPPHSQQPPSRASGTPAPMHPPGGQPGMSMAPPGMQQQQHPGQPSRPSTALSYHANGGVQHADQQPPPPISRPGTAASVRQPSQGPTPGTPMGMPPQQSRSQTPGFGQNQPQLTPQRELSRPPSRPHTAQSNHGYAPGVPPTPTSAHGHGPNHSYAGSPTTPVPGSAGGSLPPQQRGTSVPLPGGSQMGGQIMGQMGAQRSASVAPGVLQAPGHAPAPQSPISNMNMHLGGNPMGQSNSVMAGGGRLSQGSMGVMPGMSGAMMPPPLVSRQGSLGPPNMSPRIPQGMGEQAQTSTGYPPLMNGADGMMSGAMQHQQSRQQSPQRPMSRASLNGLGPMGMGMGMGMNMPLGLQTPSRRRMVLRDSSRGQRV